MMDSSEILKEIKNEVQQEIPDSNIFLFGSRATGKWHEESDWDILVLTRNKYPESVKRMLFEKLFPLSISIASSINLIVEQEDEWFNNAAYYALRLNVEPEKVAI